MYFKIINFVKRTIIALKNENTKKNWSQKRIITLFLFRKQKRQQQQQNTVKKEQHWRKTTIEKLCDQAYSLSRDLQFLFILLPQQVVFFFCTSFSFCSGFLVGALLLLLHFKILCTIILVGACFSIVIANGFKMYILYWNWKNVRERGKKISYEKKNSKN